MGSAAQGPAGLTPDTAKDSGDLGHRAGGDRENSVSSLNGPHSFLLKAGGEGRNDPGMEGMRSSVGCGVITSQGGWCWLNQPLRSGCGPIGGCGRSRRRRCAGADVRWARDRKLVRRGACMAGGAQPSLEPEDGVTCDQGRCPQPPRRHTLCTAEGHEEGGPRFKTKKTSSSPAMGATLASSIGKKKSQLQNCVLSIIPYLIKMNNNKYEFMRREEAWECKQSC